MNTEQQLLVELGQELVKIRQTLHDLHDAVGWARKREVSSVLDALLCDKHQWLKGLLAVTCPQCIIDDAYRRGYYKAPQEEVKEQHGSIKS